MSEEITGQQVDTGMAVTNTETTQTTQTTESTLLGTETKAEAQPGTQTESQTVTQATGTETKTETQVTGAPESYTDFTLPDGLTFNAEINNEFKTVAKELNLTQENAQKLINLEVKHVQNQLKAGQEAWERQVNEWGNQVKKDLGPNYKEELGYAAKAIDLAGPELAKEMRQFFDDTKIGNHPAFVKWTIAIGKAISEDKLISGSKTPKRSQDDILKDHYAKSYGNKT